MKRWFSLILAGCMLLQLTLGSPSGYMKAETDSETPVEVQEQSEEQQSKAAVNEQEQPVQTVSEADERTQTQDQSDEKPQTALKEQHNEEGKEVPVKKQINGSITVSFLTGKGVAERQSFLLTLKHESEEETRTAVMEATQGASKTSTVFENLSEGTYTLQVAAKGYRMYEQIFQMDGYDQSIQLYLGSAPQLSNAVQPGLLAYEASNLQIKEFIDALDQESGDTIYDINHDGKVDLADLQKLYDEGKEYKQQTSAVERRVPNSAVGVSIEEGTELVSGKLEDVLDAESVVTLKNTDGQAISTENPLQLTFDFQKSEQPIRMEGFTIQAPVESANKIADGMVLVEIEGQAEPLQIPIVNYYRSRRSASSPYVEMDAKGNLIVHLGDQIAVKRVTIKVTKTTQKQGSLVEISKVEFLNDMETRIPEPEMNIPKNLQGTVGDKKFTVSWTPERNVTGYEVRIEADGHSEVIKTTVPSVTVTQFKKDKLENKKEYMVSVQSVNGDWKSGYSAPIKMTPQTSSKPAAPDDVKASCGYRSINVSWKNMKDTDSYNVFYKEEAQKSFTKISNITKAGTTLNDLKDETTYVLYVTGVNELGEGPASLMVKASTLSVKRANMPSYKLINDSHGEGKLTQHIVSAKHVVGSMVNSSLDTDAKSANGLVDDSYESYYRLEDWDDAVSYHQWQWGTTVQLDQEYTMDRFTLAAPMDTVGYGAAAIYYWDSAQNKEIQAADVRIQQKDDGQGRKYYVIKLAEPIKTNRVRFGLTTSGGVRNIMVAEIRFFQYDSLESDIQALFADDLHLTLTKGVSAEQLNTLQQRLDTKDHGEYHPDQKALQMELDTAKQLFEDQDKLNDTIAVHAGLRSNKDAGIAVGGLNAWQPLGISAYAGQELVIYVGNPGMKSGQNSSLSLIATQQHAEASGFAKTVANLKVGKNEITIPQITSTDVEKGGSLYIQYNGNKDTDQYAVRVSSGTRVPKLDLYQVKDTEERMKRIRTYVEELQSFVPNLQQHEKAHKTEGNEQVDYTYDEKTCVLNITDIMLDQMMYSIPASQVWNAVNADSVEAGAEKLNASLKAMDDMMTLFYQHKGLTNNFKEGTAQNVKDKNHLPAQHLNIRYMKMFDGAFMYAAGNHIGIEWGSTSALVNSKPVEIDENGKKVGTGKYFGWGIAHEIGHNINQGSYAIAEITNNYFSLLAQADETNNGVRFKYEDVYQKVTSNVTGRSENVFTQLGMYWQLHLAYDRGYNYRTYADYDEIFENLFFARVDSYARNTALAPTPGGIKLTLGRDGEQNIMRLASAAAEKDLSDFFQRWGMVMDADTKAYMQQFEKETRAIYYVNDEARAYEIEHGASEGISGRDVATASVSKNDRSSVTLTLGNTAEQAEAILGYEIVRTTYEQGKQTDEVVGFTMDNEFTDQLGPMSNRSVSYKVTVVDKFLNRSAAVQVSPVKVEGDGSQVKENWTITTNMLSKDDEQKPAEGEDPCAPQLKSAAYRMIDDSTAEENTYTGASTNANPQITINMGKTTEVTALRYHRGKDDRNDITNYRIEISQDGKTFKKLKEGTFDFTNDVATVYFQNANNDPWIATYDAVYVRITALNQKNKTLVIPELDILGPTGDNIEFYDEKVTKTASIGILKEDYILQEKDETHEEQKIEKESLIFTGTYKGNPAYNVVMLYDEAGNIIGGTDAEGSLTANQVIFAPNPQDALLGEVSEGTWVYWIAPNDLKSVNLPEKVRAELYRVDNAMTNEGQRLVSDTLLVDIPENLPEITLTK
jgi:hypothetical protein